jgi:MoxR-like ATPase
MESIDIKALNEKIQQDSAFLDLLNLEISKSIIGQKYMIERLIIGLLTQGHILLEGVPGLAKTLAIKSLSDAINTQFSRIQFTPDLLPADILGTMIFNQAKANFEVRKGTNIFQFYISRRNKQSTSESTKCIATSHARKICNLGRPSI